MARLPLGITGLMVGFVLCAVSPTRAQDAGTELPQGSSPKESSESSEVPAAAAALAPTLAVEPTAPGALDTIRLKGGGLFRGTLLEHTPGVRSVLQLHDGTTRVLQADEIATVEAASSGPAVGASPEPAAQPQAAVASTSSSPNHLRLEVRTPRGYELSTRRAGQSDFESLCSDDCEVQLEKGSYEFSLWRPGGSTWQNGESYDLSADSRVDALLESHRASRITGGVILGAGLPAGLGVFIAGLIAQAAADDACDAVQGAFDCVAEDNGGGPLIAVGAITAIASVVVGALLLSRKDRLHLHVNERSEWRAAPAPLQAGEARDEPPAPSPRRPQAEELLRAHSAEIRQCIKDMPAMVDLRVSSEGAVEVIELYGDSERSARSCLRQVLQGLSFPAGTSEQLDLDIQPILR